MNDIAGIPYFVAEFDLNGNLKSPVTLPADVDEVIVVSHGWNNDRADAESLYSALFSNFAAIGGAPRGKAAIIGGLWPSKRCDGKNSRSSQPTTPAVKIIRPRALMPFE